MRHLIALVCLFSLGSPFTGPSAVGAENTLAAGSLDGSVATDNSGSTIYTIPLDVPPGTGGQQPELSLLYNSHQNDGLLGVGWSVRGIASITRCPQTIAQDGLSRGVGLNAYDRFCLDGKRLVAVSGDYGKDGTLYNTERQSWIRVTSMGHCGSGPCAFGVTTPEGQHLEFGVADDARILASGTETVRVWSVNKVTDRNGNYIQIRYQSDSTRGEYYPTEIQYTGNDAGSLMPQRFVRFSYEDRPDPQSAYLNGSEVRTTKRLKQISTWVKTQQVSTYNFSYHQSATSHRSLLDAVQLCGLGEECFPPTRFDWDNKVATKNTFTADSWSQKGRWAEDYINVVGDFDGDGKSDIAYLNNNSGALGLSVYESTGEAFTLENRSPSGTRWNGTRFAAADFNGDGRSDIGHLYNQMGSMNADVFLSTEDGFEKRTWYSGGQSWREDDQDVFADFNGDGLSDFAIIRNASGKNDIRIFLSNGDGFEPASWDTPSRRWVDARFLPGDFNGDGLSDLALIYNDAGMMAVDIYLSTGTGFSVAAWLDNSPRWFSDNLVSINDYNGDGRSDIAYFYNEQGYVTVRTFLSDGEMFNSEIWSKGQIRWRETSAIKPGDYNGDGLADVNYIAYSGANSMLMSVNISTGTGFTAQDWSEFKGNWDYHDYFPSDFSGDGKTDIALVANDRGTVSIKMHVAVPDEDVTDPAISYQDLLTHVTTGVGGFASFDYKPLTDLTIYSPPVDSSYPNPALHAPWYVVSRQRVGSADSEISSLFDYVYHGAKVNLEGRGWIGFAEIDVIDRSIDDPAMQTKTQNSFHQDYPLIGLLREQKVTRLSDGAVLAENRSENDYISSAEGVSTVYQKMVQNRIYSDGTENYTLSLNYTYDADYRNIIRVDDLTNTDDDSIHYCYRYHDPHDGKWWKGFFPVVRKTTRSAAACDTDVVSWSEADDLQLQRISYDDRMNQVGLALWDSTKQKWIESLLDYDRFGNPVSETDALGAKTNIAYDTVYHSFPARITLPPALTGHEPLTVETEYEPLYGNLMRWVDMNGNLVTEVPEGGLDAFGGIVRLDSIQPDSRLLKPVLLRQISKASPVGISIKLQFRTAWDEDDTENWLWENTRYNGLWQPVRMEESGPDIAPPIVSQAAYNGHSQLSQQSLPHFDGQKAETVRYMHDIKQRIIRTDLPEGVVYRTVYDPADNNIVTTEMPNPSETAVSGATTPVATVDTYDSRGRLRTSVAPNGGISTYRYDALGRPIEGIDPLGVVTSVSYNSLGQVVASTSPDVGTSTYSYTDTGLVETTIDANEQKQAFDYDALGRVIAVRDFAHDSKLTREVTYRYDSAKNGKGWLATVQTPDVAYEFSYDFLGNITERTTVTQISGEERRFTSGFTYDALGNPQTIRYPDDSEVRYDYGSGGQLTSISRRAPSETTFETLASYSDYNALGQNQQLSYGNGVEETYQYDNLGRRTHGKIVRKALVHRNVALQWNSASKLIALDDTRPSADITLNQTFSYDTMGFLTLANGTYGTLAYNYNLTGDITGTNGLTYYYNEQRKHQLDRICPVEGCGTGANQSGWNLSYDATGKLVAKTQSPVVGDNLNVWQYRYDVQGNLTSVEHGDGSEGVTSLFGYGDGWERVVSTGPDGRQTHYIDPYYVLTVPVGGKPFADTYIYGPQGVIASVGPSGAVHYLSQDQIGSTVLVTDGTGAETNTISYQPYGEIDQQIGSDTVDIRPKFTGKEYDPETGLYYFGARYYDPQMGRFTTPDPAGQFDSPYIYAANDPLTLTDPDGMAAGFDDGIEILTILVELVIAANSTEEAGSFVAANASEVARHNGTSPNDTSGLVTKVEIASHTPDIAAAAAATSSGVTIAATRSAFPNNDTLPMAVTGPRQAEVGDGAEPNEIKELPFSRLFSNAVHQNMASMPPATSSCEMSLPAGTPIATADRSKVIEELEVGDLVWSRNDATEQVELKPVSRLFTRVASALIALTIGGTTVEATPNHPFYLPMENEWRPASDLTADDQVLSLDGQLVEITAKETLDGPVKVFNFEVLNNHNYYVGENSFLVHNPPNCGRVNVGGRHGDTKQKSESKKVESDHFPPRSTYVGTIYDDNRNNMSARTLTYKEHRQFITTGSSKESQKFRDKQRQYMQQGEFHKALDMNLKAYRDDNLLNTKAQKKATLDGMKYSKKMKRLNDAKFNELKKKYGL